ncbi:Iron(III) dicitrate transport system, periplasmic iron-binding protein FecB [Clostridiaceae bacterium JG1575]|nr:Iron(III) dicitrate transport system, periplasmic iron-binding protein FecB [Clostridiaceae bacterium JG1575]
MKKTIKVLGTLLLTLAMASACSPRTRDSSSSIPESADPGQTDASQAAPWPRILTDAGNHSVQLNSPPLRIAILHTNYLEYFFALGMPPIASAGASVGTAQQALETYETLAPYRDRAQVIDLGSSREINLEAVLEAKPDVIVTFAGHGGLDGIYAQLNQIAPVVLLNFADSWQKQTRDCAKIIGKEEVAEQIIEETERAIAAAYKVVSLQNKTVALFRTNGGKAFVGRGNESYYKSFGLQAPKTYTYDYARFSLEAVAQMNPDYLIFQDYKKTSQGFVKTLEASFVWLNLACVKNEKVLYFDDSLNTFGPLAMRLAAKKFEQLFQ